MTPAGQAAIVEAIAQELREQGNAFAADELVRAAGMLREREANSRRYEWLRELREDDSISVLHWTPAGGLPPDHEEAADERTGAPLYYDQLDRAIDAAISAPPQE